MKQDIRKQDEVIEARLKSSQQSKEDATNILGDKVAVVTVLTVLTVVSVVTVVYCP